MTTPAFGQPISINSINAEIGNGTNQLGLNWVKANTRTTRGGAVNVISDMDNTHAKGYEASTTEGNCNNGNCTESNCNCGNVNCPNCLNCNAINCVNCDGSTNYLQPNCNCNCTYNCTQNTHSINCNCDCFVCNCW